MTQAFRTGSHRLPEGGLIDRQTVVEFRFDGRRYQGYSGDTLASALLANGVRIVARSVKYHRPRGIFGAGSEDPSALVSVISGEQRDPNTRAATLPLRQGLDARSQNAWPSVRFDLRALTEYFAPIIPAGFYYKTFKWPAFAWSFYEQVLRHSAGGGKAPEHADTDSYDHRHLEADVAIVGSGVAGLSAARAAAASGARVVLIEQDTQAGGALLHETATLDGLSGPEWATAA